MVEYLMCGAYFLGGVCVGWVIWGGNKSVDKKSNEKAVKMGSKVKRMRKQA